MQKITFIDQFAHMGGGQRVLLQLVWAAKKAGADVTCMVPTGDTIEERLNQQGVKVRAIAPIIIPRNLFLKILQLLPLFYVIAFKHLLFLRKQDVIYINGPRLAPIILALSPCLTARIYYHIHLKHKVWAKMFFRMALLAKRTECIFVPSSFILQDLQNFSNAFTNSKVKVIPNFLSREFATLRYKDRFNERALKNIAFVGRLELGKGVESIIQAARALPQFNFHIWGASHHASPAYAQQLRTQASANVTFHGYTAHLPTEIDVHSIQAIVAPSLVEEAFGLVAIEAMAMSCLTIVRPSGALAELSPVALTFNTDNELIELLRALESSAKQELMRITKRQHCVALHRYGKEAAKSLCQHVTAILQ